MKIKIYYFSGTGNSLAVSKDLASKLRNDLFEVDIIPIASIVQETIITPNSDVLGIVFPTYTYDVPPIVSKFIDKLNLKGEYIFAVATYFRKEGNVLFNLSKQLKKNGYSLSSGFRLKMPGNFIVRFNLVKPEENETRIMDAKNRITQITSIIKNKEPVGIEGSYKKFLALINFPKMMMPKWRLYRHFRTTEDCVLCGKCVEICPKNNIEIVNNKIIWNDDCETCFACLHWCPQEAIQCGKTTLRRSRYHHPDVKLKEMIAQSG